MPTYYDQANSRLVFLSQRATPDFWDDLWSSKDLKLRLEQAQSEKFYTGITKHFLPPESSTRLLEGGCGRGEVVVALKHAGYDTHGVDFAHRTIARLKQAMPNLPVSVGDVTNLDFPDNHFDGYWSLGVIEHSFNGYQPITKEMQRVIKPGGYLFITFPHLSPLRRAKAAAHAYPSFAASNQPPNFYQFAFKHTRVQRDLEELGFTLAYQRPIDGFKGLKEEIASLRPLLQKIGNSKSRPAQLTGAAITEVFAPLSGHVMLLVMRKQ